MWLASSQRRHAARAVAVTFAVCLVAMFGVVYAAVELASDGNQTQAVVIGRSDERGRRPS